MIDDIDDIEFLNFTEIVNDQLVKLHRKDTLYLEALPLSKVRDEYHWLLHLKNFYHLEHPKNPLLEQITPNANILALRIAENVWNYVHFKPYAPKDIA